MDINEKLRSLTPEQANKLAGHLNSCYPDKKKPAPAKKKPAAESPVAADAGEPAAE